MASLRVALVQARSRGAHPELALREGERVCREAAAHGADVVLFPELWQLAYASCPAEPARRAAWLAHATTIDGPFVSHFRELARELGLAISITYLEDWPGAPRNTATLIDRHGDPALTYAKVHTCDFGMEAALTPGDGFRVADLDTRAGTVRVGLMICADREFPESARVLMLGRARAHPHAERLRPGPRSARAVPRPRVREHGRRRAGQLRHAGDRRPRQPAPARR